jgi:tetratricopeptide (TPR) repeat protein
LADWTEEKLELDLAISYARVAIDLDPSSAVAAYKAGRLARRLAVYEEAERLFKAAIERGRAALDWETVSRAYAGLGRSQEQQGEFEDAEASHMRSLATALDHGLRELQSDGYHSLAVVAFERDKTDEGVSYARKALDACGARKDRIAQLAHDLAYVWLIRESTPERVLSIFNEVLQVVEEPVRRLVVLANIAHSYGKLGDSAKFDGITSHVEALLGATSAFGENHAQALLDLGYGAAALGRDQQARRYAERSHAIAQKRKELFVVAKAEDFLQELPRVGPDTNTFVRVGALFNERRIDDLVYEIMEALR